MRSVTSPLFPAQAGAVTLQDVIDAREGDRLPLELALYLSAELGKQVAQLQALGRQGALDPKKVWCTSKGAVVVHEAFGAAREPHGFGRLIYRLLSGAGDVSAWPPSYFNPSVAESLDAAVMSAVSDDGPEKLSAVVEAVTAASSALDQDESVAGMARLVFAVPDEPKPAPIVSTPEPEAVVPPRRRMLRARHAAIAGGIALVLAVVAGVSRPAAPAAVVEAAAPSVREKTVAAWRAQQVRKTATAKTQKEKAKR